MALITEKTDLDNILLLVQDIDNNSSIGMYGNAAAIVTKSFISHLKITRGADNTSHSAGMIINSNGIATPPYFDFNGFGNKLKIKEIKINSSVTARAMTWLLSSSPTIGAQTFNDKDVFAPSYSDYTSNPITAISGTPTYLWGTSFVQTFVNSAYASNLNIAIDTDNLQRLYLIPIVQTTFTPASGEVFDVTITGDLAV